MRLVAKGGRLTPPELFAENAFLEHFGGFQAGFQPNKF